VKRLRLESSARAELLHETKYYETTRRFPFSAVYREEPAEIVVYAIRPDAKEPGYWLPRTR
jgi:hypothetical protein